MRYVLAVAEHSSFTRAAESCHVVQSALSHQIAKLERELGTPLFARTSRQVRLTPAGHAFVPHARACLETAERATTEAAAAVGAIRGRLTIGMIPTVAAVDVASVLARYRREHPQVSITLQVDGSERLVAKVREGRVDCAFLGMPDEEEPRGVRGRVLARDRLVALVPPTHPLASRRRVSLARLARETFVDFPAGSAGRLQTDRAFEGAGLDREVPFEVTSPDLMIALAREGLAVALLPSALAGEVPGLGAVTVQSGPRRVEHLVWSELTTTPAADAFLELVPS